MYHRPIANGVESMTKKDYELIQSALNFETGESELLKTVKRNLVVSFAVRLMQDNPKFQFDLFAKGCGLKTGESNG